MKLIQLLFQKSEKKKWYNLKNQFIEDGLAPSSILINSKIYTLFSTYVIIIK